MATQPGTCEYCGEDFKHLPSHEWQCKEKPEENEENDVTDPEGSDVVKTPSGKSEQEPDEGTDGTEPEKETDKGTDDSGKSSDSNAGVIVDKVQPQEKDTRKNKDESEPDQEKDSEDDWVELDYNSGKQVKTILETTDLNEPRQAQKLLKAFKTGETDDIPKFDEIRLSDGELR